MMGNRGYKGGDECDAFSRKARRIVPFGRGKLRALKRQFSKRMRATTKIAARAEARDAEAAQK